MGQPLSTPVGPGTVMDPGSIMNVGIIGCGNIIAAYLATFPRLHAVRLVAVADLDHSRAEAVAAGQEGCVH